MDTGTDRSSPVTGHVLIALFGVLLGLGAGYLVFRAKPGKGTARCPATSKAGSAGAEASSGNSAGGTGTGGASGGAAARAGGGNGSLASLYRSTQARANFLAEENKRLTKLLHYYKEDQKAAQGEPSKWPAKVKDRFRKDALRKAVETALKEAGIQGSVTDVDCREYPCVVAGELTGAVGPEVFNKLKNTKAMAPYKNDGGMSTMSRSRRKQPDGTEKTTNHFGVSFVEHPKGEPPPEIRKRTAYRMQQLMEALSGQ